ncbi:MAG: tripartite tricarboxylate transporter permease, partial [Pseudomonadota bacterium]
VADIHRHNDRPEDVRRFDEQARSRLTLGIPGSGTTAVMLGALISYGVQPGPRLFVEAPNVFWAVIVSMYIGNIVLLILNLPLIPYIARLLALPEQILVPLIMFFSLCGVYLVSFNTFDIQLMVLFAVLAIVLRLTGYPMAPLILGFVLGKLMEENLRRALEIADGWNFVWERPITLCIFILTALCLIAPFREMMAARRGAKDELAGEGG